MPTTIAHLTAANLNPESAGGVIDFRNSRPVIDHSAGVSTTFRIAFPESYAGGSVDVKVYAQTSTATSGTTDIGGSFDKQSDGDNIDSTSFATQITQTYTANATPGQIVVTTLTFTVGQLDGLGAGLPGIFRFERLSAGDAMVGDLEINDIVIEEQ